MKTYVQAAIFLLLLVSSSSSDHGELRKEIHTLRQLLNQETLIRMNMDMELRRLKRRLDSQTRVTDEARKLGVGDIYVRWGKSNCRNGSEIIYTGQVGGSDNYQQSGAAVTHLCLPLDPIYDRYDRKVNNHAYVFGAEFDMFNIDVKGTLFDKTKYTTKGVSCAVCRPNNPASVIMIPGRNACYSGMTKEYSGYLMAGYHSHVGASEYICVDGDADIFPTAGQKWRKILYPVESMCEGPLKCPPYIHGAEMTCVVCSA